MIAKYVNSTRVFSIDVNPVAVSLMQDNIRLNRVYGRVVPSLGDAKTIVERQLRGQADRILMPLPARALSICQWLFHSKTVRWLDSRLHFRARGDD